MTELRAPVALGELLLLARQAADGGVVAVVLGQGALRKHVAQAGRGARPPEQLSFVRSRRQLRCRKAVTGGDDIGCRSVCPRFAYVAKHHVATGCTKAGVQLQITLQYRDPVTQLMQKFRIC
jgi:hypothetical protein